MGVAQGVLNVFKTVIRPEAVVRKGSSQAFEHLAAFLRQAEERAESIGQNMQPIQGAGDPETRLVRMFRRSALQLLKRRFLRLFGALRRSRDEIRQGRRAY